MHFDYNQIAFFSSGETNDSKTPVDITNQEEDERSIEDISPEEDDELEDEDGVLFIIHLKFLLFLVIFSFVSMNTLFHIFNLIQSTLF